ncbi:hypothetical protein AB0F11_31605 [Streptomyces sp. NPDC032472]|uniref:hypothetical protein n=1 Tax=Streptomyces sp. NPDC032472 TaxID=3155018 RepID=UPI0033F82975
MDGWDFSWLDGRATEQRPSWGCRKLLCERLARVGSALDVQTGGGEVLAGAGKLPPLMAATESWPPNVDRATELLHPLGAVVVADSDDAAAEAAAAGLEVVDLRSERLRTEFHDIGAVICFLRKAIWVVPGHTVKQYRDRLAERHERIERDGPFVAHTARLLIEARTPA